MPEHVWVPAYDAADQLRDGARVAELTDLTNLTGWPTGMRVVVRSERSHPGALLRFEDVDAMRITALGTDAGCGQLADLQLRRRRRELRGTDPPRQGHRAREPVAEEPSPRTFSNSSSSLSHFAPVRRSP